MLNNKNTAELFWAQLCYSIYDRRVLLAADLHRVTPFLVDVTFIEPFCMVPAEANRVLPVDFHLKNMDRTLAQPNGGLILFYRDAGFVGRVLNVLESGAAAPPPAAVAGVMTEAGNRPIVNLST